MPTTTKMLEKAEEWERQAQELQRKAQALRQALAELNGDLTERKQERAGGMISQAIELRREQLAQTESSANGNQARGPATTQPERRVQRQALIRTFLTGASRPLKEIRAHLAEHGHPLSKDRVRQIMMEIPDVEAVGLGIKAVWQLGATKPSAKKQAAKRQPKRPAVRRQPSYGAAKRAQRQETARLLTLFPAKGEGTLTAEDIHKQIGPFSKINVMMRHGYLAKNTSGEYHRTAKVFTP